jgi:nitrate reductase gamma subunit
MNLLNNILFVVFPYVAIVVFVVGLAYRYARRSFTISSLSSQFLESRQLFWGSVPFHIGLLVLFFGHLVAFLLPQATLAWNQVPVRLLVLEVSGLVFGITVVLGLVALMYRRFTNARIRAVTTPTDILIELLLLAQVVLGVWVALGFRWGSTWFAADLSPYLWSIVLLAPETAAVYAMPWIVKLHIVGAFVILFAIPFTRLAHVIVAPLHYIVRPYQQVIWNWDRKTIRDPGAAWSSARPKNN